MERENREAAERRASEWKAKYVALEAQMSTNANSNPQPKEAEEEEAEEGRLPVRRVQSEAIGVLGTKKRMKVKAFSSSKLELHPVA